MKITKAMYQSREEDYRNEIRSLKKELELLNKIPKLEHSYLTSLIIALEKTTEEEALDKLKGEALKSALPDKEEEGDR